MKFSWKKLSVISVLLIVLSLSAVLIFRPVWLDWQIDKKAEMLAPYLEEQYPEENWNLTTVPHREDGYKHLNPYYIGVVFEDEPEVTYHYWVENENEIYQIMYSANKNLNDLQFKEENN
ncbi:DUF3139 domain-containing protein [Alkalicoccus daliensis]|uniref:DUF3139 domain-containing protein n=1 Tax=Alkalicoccus daliensis TaxID=745820 RepID=A0A1H0K077_9BACI|nr:DUF3139 domain-containing protein [Alkalicoccus daliensis]SDO49347.1 Protein of unknown function [Alkalicoccus daliensis]